MVYGLWIILIIEWSSVIGYRISVNRQPSTVNRQPSTINRYNSKRALKGPLLILSEVH
jgi:hypothetical protein